MEEHSRNKSTVCIIYTVWYFLHSNYKSAGDRRTDIVILQEFYSMHNEKIFYKNLDKHSLKIKCTCMSKVIFIFLEWMKYKKYQLASYAI